MWTRAELKDNAKKFFKFNYWKMVLVALIITMIGGGGGGFSANINYNIMSMDSDPYGFRYMTPAEITAFMVGFLSAIFVASIIAVVLTVFVFNPLIVGAQRFFVVSHYQKAELNELGHVFSHSYLNVVKTMFLRSLYIFLWSLLFVIPGIIKAYEYMMIPYILAENPEIDSKEAFAMSKQMMDGNKWKAFVLELSFFGWMLLSAFTCGILAVFYVNPYMFMTEAELYVALKEITYGGGQNNYQNVYQQDNGQWNNNNGQWNNNNGQWNNDNGQWNNNSNQWNNNNGQWNNNNNQWNNNNNQWNNDNSQWNNNNDPWNNNQPNNDNQWDDNSPTQ